MVDILTVSEFDVALTVVFVEFECVPSERHCNQHSRVNFLASDQLLKLCLVSYPACSVSDYHKIAGSLGQTRLETKLDECSKQLKLVWFLLLGTFDAHARSQSLAVVDKIVESYLAVGFDVAV